MYFLFGSHCDLYVWHHDLSGIHHNLSNRFISFQFSSLMPKMRKAMFPPTIPCCLLSLSNTLRLTPLGRNIGPSTVIEVMKTSSPLGVSGLMSNCHRNLFLQHQSLLLQQCHQGWWKTNAAAPY